MKYSSICGLFLFSYAVEFDGRKKRQIQKDKQSISSSQWTNEEWKKKKLSKSNKLPMDMDPDVFDIQKSGLKTYDDQDLTVEKYQWR